jgi:7-carboxy-7-deazaguanine synthase
MPYGGEVLPIAEIFDSLQGEGQWVGTPMKFIRLAGCNVGKPAKALKMEPLPILSTGREAMACTSWDGRSFPCDTDYAKKYDTTVKQVIEDVWQKHICVTGGEPFLHQYQLENLFYEAGSRDITIHVETSGTIVPHVVDKSRNVLVPGYWITVSPKINCNDQMVKRADELKLLVDEGFDEGRLTVSMLQHPNVFVCAINGVEQIGSVNEDNVQRCIEILRRHPNWRFSPQLHKYHGWR